MGGQEPGGWRFRVPPRLSVQRPRRRPGTDHTASFVPSHDVPGGILREVRNAEALGEQGRFDLALRAYAEVLRRRLAEVANEGLPMAAADVAVMERAANLAAAVGEATAAANILQAAASLCADAGNVESSDYAALRRVGVLLNARATCARLTRRSGT